MLQYTNFKLALLAAADTEPGTVYSHPFEEGLYVVPETRAEEQRLVDASVVLAERANITHSALARLERDEAEPRMTTVRKLAEALGVEPRELVKRVSDE